MDNRFQVFISWVWLWWRPIQNVANEFIKGNRPIVITVDVLYPKSRYVLIELVCPFCFFYFSTGK